MVPARQIMSRRPVLPETLISTEGVTTTGHVRLLKHQLSFDTARGAFENVNIEGEMQKFPRSPDRWKSLEAESEYVSVHITLEEFWNFSEDTWSFKEELPERSIYGRYSYSHENNYLYITLAYHPQDFDSQIKLLLSGANLQHICFQIQFAETLGFEADQNGTIIRFSINSETKEEIVPDETEYEVMEKLSNLDDKIFKYVQSLDERMKSIEKAIRHETHQNITELDAIKKQMAKPTDLLSRLVLKIPIIGSILRFLAK